MIAGADLPLSPPVYHILLALGGDSLHGYGIMRAFEELAPGAGPLLPGSLYATLARMLDAGLVEEAEPPRDDRAGGPPRRYYRVTPAGRAVARAESERLGRLLAAARKQRLVPGGPR